MAPRILVFGQTGQVACALSQAAPKSGIRLTNVPRSEADFSQPGSVAAALAGTPEVDVVVNAVAYTDVNRAESESNLAFRVNGESVGVLAKACAERGLPLIHLSTDYVFDGRKTTPSLENDPVAPLNVYGASKLDGEERLRASWSKHVILRTSWVYSAAGRNFVRTIFTLGYQRDELKVVQDQYGAPTSAKDIARAVLQVAGRLVEKRGEYGIFHFTASGETSWYGLAQAIAAQTGFKGRVLPITSGEWPTPAQRPANSRLNCGKLRQVYGVEQIPWQLALAPVLKDLMAQSTRSES